MQTSESLLRKLSLLLGEIAGVDAESLSDRSSPATLPEWDSMANIHFIGAIEEEFGVAISTAEALTLHSLGDVARFVREKAPQS